MQIKITARCKIENIGRDAPWEEGAKAGDIDSDSDGGKVEPGPWWVEISGFGGLGLEGIVGNEESDGEKAARPGEGNNGSISGDSVGEKIGASGNIVGEAEIAETGMFFAEANEQLHDIIKAMNIAENDQKLAMAKNQLLNDGLFLKLSMNVFERENCVFGES